MRVRVGGGLTLTIAENGASHLRAIRVVSNGAYATPHEDEPVDNTAGSGHNDFKGLQSVAAVNSHTTMVPHFFERDEVIFWILVQTQLQILNQPFPLAHLPIGAKMGCATMCKSHGHGHGHGRSKQNAQNAPT